MRPELCWVISRKIERQNKAYVTRNAYKMMVGKSERKII
jgi:hypothetical protein